MNRSLGTIRTTYIQMVIFLSMSGCATGIPDANGWSPAPPQPCQIVVTDGAHSACLSREQFARWLQRNGF